MKIIVLIHHDRHTDDHISVFAYSDENLEIIKKKMEEYWQGGSWGWYGDLPSENGEQFGVGEDYYSSYSIVEVQNA